MSYYTPSVYNGYRYQETIVTGHNDFQNKPSFSFFKASNIKGLQLKRHKTKTENSAYRKNTTQ